ncbi:thiopurine S-methyltransferase [Trypanosoma conorhini]|uniref:Thiopurine S-methyltransferase n=1 Tax=Trypanosoma conorhini TaxID=83891 RepID=A0A3R7NQE3_9TRYP|nr:thiopurine S-methyltransferase [Trypanosoma conorhini]RNF06091.1 thiopurine S-methyltransferase [Trypanosoma conorhini]
MKLGSHNVKEFWANAWATHNTGWKTWEQLASFTRILTAFLHGAGFLSAEEQAEAERQKEGAYGAVSRFLAGKTAFVPLCGDSAALAYMVGCRVKHVVAVDLSEEALTTQRQVKFPDLQFQTTRLEPAEGATEGIEVHEATMDGSRITLFQGDLMQLPRFKAYCELEVDFLFDCASMMAIPAGLRGAYVKAVTSVLRPSSVVAYQQAVRRLPEERDWGPPFMVDMDEVLQLYRQYTGREYKATPVLNLDVEGKLYPQWYAILPQN